MSLTNNIKCIDFERYRESHKRVRNENVSMAEHNDHVDFLNNTLHSILEAAVGEGIIKRSDLNGMKKFQVRQRYEFVFEIEAEDKEAVDNLLTDYNNMAALPTMDIPTYGVVEGEYLDEKISEEKGYK